MPPSGPLGPTELWDNSNGPQTAPQGPMGPDDYVQQGGDYLWQLINRLGRNVGVGVNMARDAIGAPLDDPASYTMGEPGTAFHMAVGAAPYFTPAAAPMAAFHAGKAASEIGDTINNPTSENISKTAIDVGSLPLMMTAAGKGIQGAVGGTASDALAALGSSVARRTGAAVAAGGAGAGATMALMDDAEAAKKRKAAALPQVQQQVQQASTAAPSSGADPLEGQIKGDPEGLALYQQLKQLQEKATAAVPGVNAASSDKVRQQAAIDAAAIQAKLVSRIQEINSAHEPWDVAHPELAKNWFGIRMGLPMALGAALHVGPPKGWQQAITKAENAMSINPGGIRGALDSGSFSKPSVARQMTNKAQAYQDNWNNPINSAMRTVTPVVGGALVGGELANIPNQYNAIQAPIGSPEQVHGEKNFLDPAAFGSGMVSGAGMTYLGGELRGRLGAKAPNAATDALGRNLSAARAPVGRGTSPAAEPVPAQLPTVAPEPKMLPPAVAKRPSKSPAITSDQSSVSTGSVNGNHDELINRMATEMKGGGSLSTDTGKDLMKAMGTDPKGFEKARKLAISKGILPAAAAVAGAALSQSSDAKAGETISAMVGSGGQLHNKDNGQFVSPDDPNVRVKRMRAAAIKAMAGR